MFNSHWHNCSTAWARIFFPEFSEHPAEVITDRDNENQHEESDGQIAHTLRNEVDEKIKTLNKLSLFTEDLGFDPLISKPTRIINQWIDKWGSFLCSGGREKVHWEQMDSTAMNVKKFLKLNM